MRRIALHKPGKRTAVTLITVLLTFLIIYLGGAYSDASRRYAHAASISKSHAHTNVGREGYEYIFEPNTQIFIDKILPNEAIITAVILIQDYLFIGLDSGCGFLDVDICAWLRFDVFYSYDQTPLVLRLVAYASLAALLAGSGIYLLFKTASP